MITSVEKPVTVVEPAHFPDKGFPEFLLLGRSNVGKSSLINKLLARKNIAYTSKNPGKTQTLNFYLVNNAFYFVDVPGYGYARVSKTQREAFGRMIEGYLNTRDTLRHAYLLIDLRHDPTEDDRIMVDYLKHIGIPFTIIATKADKLSNNQQAKNMTRLKKTFALPGSTGIIPFSAVTGLNRDRILTGIFDMSQINA